MEDMMSGFDWIVSAWITKVFSWEKPWMIFSYRGVICDDSSGSCTQQVCMTKLFDPWTTFDVSGFNVTEVIVK